MTPPSNTEAGVMSDMSDVYSATAQRSDDIMVVCQQKAHLCLGVSQKQKCSRELDISLSLPLSLSVCVCVFVCVCVCVCDILYPNSIDFLNICHHILFECINNKNNNQKAA